MQTTHPLLQAIEWFFLAIAYIGPISYAIYFGWNWRYLNPKYKFPVKIGLWLSAIFGFLCFVLSADNGGHTTIETMICLGLGIWFLAIPICVGFFWDCHELDDWEAAAWRRIHGKS